MATFEPKSALPDNATDRGKVERIKLSGPGDSTETTEWIDVATQAELDAHVNDTSAAHAASAISFSATGTIASTDAQAAIAEVATDAAAALAAVAATNLSGSGSPNGVVSATVGTLYRDTSTGYLWSKITGTGNTGWEITNAIRNDIMDAGAAAGENYSTGLGVALVNATNGARGNSISSDTALSGTDASFGFGHYVNFTGDKALAGPGAMHGIGVYGEIAANAAYGEAALMGGVITNRRDGALAEGYEITIEDTTGGGRNVGVGIIAKMQAAVTRWFRGIWFSSQGTNPAGDAVYIDGPAGWTNYIVAKDSAGTTQYQVDAAGNVTSGFTTTHGIFRRGDAARFVAWYDGNPEGVVSAAPGAVIYNTLGGAGTVYYKASGTGNTNWVPVARKVVVDIRDYIVDDGTTDNAAAVTAAIAATPAGGILDFRGAQNAIMIGSPIDLIEQRTYVFKNTAGHWPYRQVSPFPGSIKATAAFSGDALVRIREKTISGRTPDNDTIYVSGMVVDGTNLSTGNIDCIRIEGLCRDLHFDNCVGTQAEGTGRCWHFLTGAGTAAPRGIRMKTCVAHSGENYGFRFNGVTDAYLQDLLAVSNSLDGIYFSNSGENHLVGCRAVFNTQRGFFFDGNTTSGGTTVTACTTDRNGRDGFRVTQTGTQPLTFVGCIARRDGSSSTSSNYSGFHIEGSAGNTVVPVDIVGCLVFPGVDDGGGGSQTPQHAVRAIYAQRVNVVGGDFHGISSGFSDGGNNTIAEWTPETYWASGAIGSKARVTPSKVSPSELLAGRAMSDVGTPASGDLILLQDVSDSSKLKVAQFSTFGGGGGGSVAGGADHLALITIGVS